MSAAEDFAEIVRAQLGNAPAEQTPAEPGSRLPAPNVAQGTSNGSTPQRGAGDMFVDFLSQHLRAYDPDTHPQRADPAAAGRGIGWQST